MNEEITGAEPLLLRAEEAAKLLSLSRSTVFQMIATGELPCVRVGRAVRVSRSGLERWVRDRSGEPAPFQEPKNLTRRT